MEKGFGIALCLQSTLTAQSPAQITGPFFGTTACRGRVSPFFIHFMQGAAIPYPATGSAAGMASGRREFFHVQRILSVVDLAGLTAYYRTMKTVYIETSIPSFYHEVRQEPEMVARRHWTRQWWSHATTRYKLVTSEGVVAELQEGEYPTQVDAVELVADLPRLDVVDEIADIIDIYLDNHLMPKERLGDAFHLAICSYHKCDFLLTWNCSHIANANKFEHIRIINARLGLFVPALVTPLELVEESSHG